MFIVYSSPHPHPIPEMISFGLGKCLLMIIFKKCVCDGYSARTVWNHKTHVRTVGLVDTGFVLSGL